MNDSSKTKPTTTIALAAEERLPSALSASQEIAADSLAGAPVDEKGQVIFRHFGDIMRYSQMLMSTGMQQKGDQWEGLAIKIQLGAEIGLGPLASVQNVAVINNRPSVWGDAMLALCMTASAPYLFNGERVPLELFDHAAFDEFFELNGERVGEGSIPLEVLTQENRNGEIVAVAECRRQPDGKVKRQEFSLAQARKAGLYPAKPESVWSKYTLRMIKMRARAFVLRDCFPDVLRGITSIEELATANSVLDLDKRQIVNAGEGSISDGAQQLGELKFNKPAMHDHPRRPQSQESTATPEGETMPESPDGEEPSAAKFRDEIAAAKSTDELQSLRGRINAAYESGYIKGSEVPALRQAMSDAEDELGERAAMQGDSGAAGEPDGELFDKGSPEA